jgi:hypothetical protein
MAQSNPIPEIKALLQHEYIRERRKGIEKAADLLAQGLYRQKLREMLTEVAQGDLASNLAERAQQVLDEDDQRHASYPPRYEGSDRQHMVGAVCSKGHPNYYDKRVICPGEDRYRFVRADGVEVDEIVVKCEVCGEEMKIEVDCEDYK